MTKFRLDIEYDYDFLLAAISCHEKPYRLCWAVNRALNLKMMRIDPLKITLKKNEVSSEFALFREENETSDTAWFLIANRTTNSLLVPEQPQADYFFIAKGPFNSGDHERMLAGLKNIQFVLMSYRVDPATLKSRQNLLF
ncbi:MAG TPA: IPExxxVDY family protein [Bacteroidia bacterium]|nr:IPExxxVDY family protein [Bacteroidia bacterium]